MGLDAEAAFALMERTMGLSGADQTEVLVSHRSSALTRFANSTIHQNVATRDTTVSVRVVYGRRIGVAEVNRTDEEALREVVQRAEAIARVQEPNRDFRSLPAGGRAMQVENFSKATACSTPEERAGAVAEIVSIAGEKGVRAFGALGTTRQALGVMNSLGARQYDDMTKAHLTVTAIASESGSKGYGWAEDANVDVRRVDHRLAAKAAVEKAVASLKAETLEPGDYAVVLEPVAVADIVSTLAFTTFGALEYQEGRSYVCGRLGQKVLPENISLRDDGTAAGGFPMAFDFEGVPKRRVDLIGNGVAKGLVYDSYTAGREEGKESTGHALPAPNPYGPVPMNQFMDPGDATLGEMVEETRRGIYVTRFHYTNTIDPTKTLWTGMTRDGTFLIEDGELRGAVKNLRFTNSIVESLGSGGLVGRETKDLPFPDYFPAGGTTVPALQLNRFRFTGVTEF